MTPAVPVATLLPVSLISVQWCTVTCEYLREFSKKIKMTQMLFSVAWEKTIHEKNEPENLMTLSL